MAKPRILVPISLQFSIRYLLRTGLLEKMGEFCEPVVMLAWQDAGLEQELASVSEVHSLTRSRWGARYEQTRGILNTWHQNRYASPSTPIRERRSNLDRSFKERVKRKLRLSMRELSTVLPGSLEKHQAEERSLLWTDTNAHEVKRIVKRLNLDGVFSLTPFIPDEELTVRVCGEEGLPSCAAILSFDNLTTRPWIPMLFDSYLLWNRHNAEQLRRGYPEAADRPVTIVGSPQFDFYWDKRYITDEAEWRKSLGLPGGRPVVLFGGGYFSCAPHEPQFLAHLDEAIERGQIPGKPVVLFRRHPVDPMGRWEPILKQAKNVVHDDPWEFRNPILGHTNILDADIAKLASTLYHTVAHVNVASTLSLDGAIVDRPQIGPAYDESAGGKYHQAAFECYEQEHFLPILNSGGLAVARSREALVTALGEAIRNPGEKQEGRKRIVREICTFDDGRCTARVAEAVEAFVCNRVSMSAAQTAQTS